MNHAHHSAFRRIIIIVAALNLAYFGIEFAMAWIIGSVSLFADSIDFLEDASVNLLILLALNWTASRRAHLGMALAGILLCPAIATLWMAWQKFSHLIPPEPTTLSIIGMGALLINFTCALLLARHKSGHGSLGKAAFLSARNDVAANIGIILAGLLTWQLRSAWPDLLVGLAIAAMNADAAHEIWNAARKEKRDLVQGQP